MSGASLLETIRGLLERTYLMRSGLSELGPFVIGDEGYRRLYRGAADAMSAGEAGCAGARTMVREMGPRVRACIYFPDALISQLEAHPPQRGLGEPNVDPFATFVEEIDHLLLIAERSRRDLPVSLFELELHANVSKHLVLSRFLAGGTGRLSPEKRCWLRRRLFDAGRFSDEDPSVRARYRDAARYALQLIDRLVDLRPEERLGALRRFHAAGARGKLELIGQLAAEASS